MQAYLILLFPDSHPRGGHLERWLSKMGAELRIGDALFVFHSSGKSETFPTPATGTLKIHLCREGENLQSGMEIAVLSCSEAQAHEIEKKGLGKILTPDEYQTALAHAEAASIRLPPHEL